MFEISEDTTKEQMCEKCKRDFCLRNHFKIERGNERNKHESIYDDE